MLLWVSMKDLRSAGLSEAIHRAGYRAFFAHRGWEIEDLSIFTGRRAEDVFATEPGPWSGLDPAALHLEVLPFVPARPPDPVPGAPAPPRTGLRDADTPRAPGPRRDDRSPDQGVPRSAGTACRQVLGGKDRSPACPAAMAVTTASTTRPSTRTPNRSPAMSGMIRYSPPRPNPKTTANRYSTPGVDAKNSRGIALATSVAWALVHRRTPACSSKLVVSRRHEAVRKARSLQLIPS